MKIVRISLPIVLGLYLALTLAVWAAIWNQKKQRGSR